MSDMKNMHPVPITSLKKGTLDEDSVRRKAITARSKRKIEKSSQIAQSTNCRLPGESAPELIEISAETSRIANAIDCERTSLNSTFVSG